MAQAATALHRQLDRFPPYYHAQIPPFAPPNFTERFQIQWAALVPFGPYLSRRLVEMADRGDQ